MNNIKVIIIDSGVRIDRFPSGLTISGFQIQNKELHDSFNDEYGHGRAIFGIGYEGCDEFADILNIKIFDHEGEIEEEALLYALNYIDQYFSPDRINLSLGIVVSELQDELYAVCDKLAKKAR